MRKDLEGNGRVTILISAWRASGKTTGKNSGYPMSLRRFEPRTSQDRSVRLVSYSSICLFCHEHGSSKPPRNVCELPGFVA
jgi:hypothetical protein